MLGLKLVPRPSASRPTCQTSTILALFRTKSIGLQSRPIHFSISPRPRSMAINCRPCTNIIGQIIRPSSTTSRPFLRKIERKFSPMSWFLLLIPLTTFSLGTWQVKRRKWKEELLAELKSRSNAAPCDLPENLSELDKLEYYPVLVRGKFDHTKEMYLGPRSLIVDGDGANQSSLISQTQSGQSGSNVVTPFHLADRNMIILVNRGWVPSKNKKPETRKAGQVQGEVELIGVVRLDEKRAPFMPKNQADEWFYRDLPKMAERVGAEPVFLDALASSSVVGGPIGGQTRISLRNEHLSYILTWYGLSAITTIMWYRHFIHKVPAL